MERTFLAMGHQLNVLGRAISIIVVLTALYLVASRFINKGQDCRAQNLPIVGPRNHEWFSWERATLRSFSLSKQWAFEGYATYSKANSPFIIPCLDRGPVVVIPPKQLKSVYGLPTNVLDMYGTANETLQSKYTIADQNIVSHPFQVNVVRNQITRNLEHLSPLIATELDAGFERWWGSSTTEWKELGIWDSCLKLIAGASNGAFCGAPLCRDAVFLESLRDHAMAMFVGAIIINATPHLLRPITGTLVSWACRWRFRHTLKLCLPFIKERLAHTKRARADPTFCWTAPRDGLQWIIEESYACPDHQAQLDPVRVTHRLLYVNNISLHSTAYTVQNVILDIYNSEQSDALVKALRDECEAVLREAGGSWTREAVHELKLVDATIRESMRLTPFASVGLPRTVVDPHGISLDGPDGVGKFHVPRGTVIAAPMDPIHRDDAIYTDANRFNPFRFLGDAAARSIFDVFDNTGKDREAGAGKSKSSVTLDDAFLGFGFGKHACPGRFFALNEMKMFVAHMVLHYDVECLDRRPDLTNVVWLKVPYNDGRVRVRKRSAVSD